MLLSNAPQPNPLTYARMASYFKQEGYDVETRTLRDLGKELADHFLGRFHDNGPSGSRIFDRDTWDMWKVIVENKLQGKNRPYISSILSEMYGVPIEQAETTIIDGEPSLDMPRPLQRQMNPDIRILHVQNQARQWKELVHEERTQKHDAIKQLKEVHYEEIELRHQKLLDEKRKREEAERKLYSLDMVLPKRRELLKRAAQLNGFFNRKKRLKILNEITALELDQLDIERWGVAIPDIYMKFNLHIYTFMMTISYNQLY